MNEITIKTATGIRKVDLDALTWDGDHHSSKHYVVKGDYNCPDRIVLQCDSDDAEDYAEATAKIGGGHTLRIAEDCAGERQVYVDNDDVDISDDDMAVLMLDYNMLDVLRHEVELRDEPDEDAQREAIEDWVATLPTETVWRIDRCRGFNNEWTLWYGLAKDPTGQCGDDAEVIDDRDEVIDYMMLALAGGSTDNYRAVCHADRTCKYNYSVVVDGYESDWDFTRDDAIAEAASAEADGSDVIIRRYKIIMSANGKLSDVSEPFDRSEWRLADLT